MKAALLRASLAATLSGALALSAQDASAQIAVQNQGYIPFSDAPINYRSNDLSDPVALLQKKLNANQASLAFDPTRGYLPSVLALLDIPVDSQTLVFSKTSFQYPKISPDHPRALYFNDDVYVGSVHDGKAVEIVSFDPTQGAIFYLLDEHRADKPTFQRAELDCTQCHIAAGTRGVPGVLLRSVYPTATGTTTNGARTYITDQESPFKERWGGWYVTNDPLAAASHLGNKAVATPGSTPAAQTTTDASGATLAALGKPYDDTAYLTPGSDAVALLVLAHQTQMHNLITLTNYRTRIALYSPGSQPQGSQSASGAATALADLPDGVRNQIQKPAEQLLRYLLFANEAALPATDGASLIASSAFARSFAARGPRDARGRSLRDFDLGTHVFRYPCSYLIYSEAFDALPEPAKGYVYHRLLQVLSGEDQSSDFARLTSADRRNVLEILLATKQGLPQEWLDYQRAHPAANSPSSVNSTRSPR
ncbi:MAG: hypothetical protein QM718_05980 [Steroidobacteraceae bacterium]